MTYILIIINVFIMASGQLFFKQAAIFMNAHGDLALVSKYFTNPWFYGAMVLYAVSTLVWTQTLTRVDLSIAYPIMSLSYILVMLGAYFFLHETLSITSIAGSILIVVGISLIVLQ